MNTVTGNIKQIGEVVSFDSGFTKREIVVTTNDMYPQDIAVDFIKDNTSKLDGFSAGQSVEIHFNLRGNEYNNRHYVSLQGWKIEKATAPQQNESDLPG